MGGQLGQRVELAHVDTGIRGLDAPHHQHPVAAVWRRGRIREELGKSQERIKEESGINREESRIIRK